MAAASVVAVEAPVALLPEAHAVAAKVAVVMAAEAIAGSDRPATNQLQATRRRLYAQSQRTRESEASLQSEASLHLLFKHSQRMQARNHAAISPPTGHPDATTAPRHSCKLPRRFWARRILRGFGCKFPARA